MEIIRGKQTLLIDSTQLAASIAAYDTVHVDLGTGDGRYVRHMAQTYQHTFVIGIDACRENLIANSRRAPPNALFIIANAYSLPLELEPIATQVTINFPWGSLLKGLLNDEPDLLDNLIRIAPTQVDLTVCLNAGALNVCGWSLHDGAHRIYHVLSMNGYRMKRPHDLTLSELQAYPTTWAKRLAYGRDPRAVCLKGTR